MAAAHLRRRSPGKRFGGQKNDWHPRHNSRDGGGGADLSGVCSGGSGDEDPSGAGEDDLDAESVAFEPRDCGLAGSGRRSGVMGRWLLTVCSKA